MKTKIMAFIIRRLGWGWLPSSLFQLRRRIRNRLWSSDPGPVCVDICSGSGLTSIEKAMQWPDTVFYCLDLDRSELEKGRALSAALGLTNIVFVQGNACYLPFEKGVANTVIVANILRDLPDIMAALKNWSAVMQKHARMIIETPVAPQKHILFKIKTIRNLVQRYVNPDHGFADGELENYLGLINLVPAGQTFAYKGIGVLARECHYILTAIHPVFSALFWLPLYLLLIIGQAGSGRGNAITLISESGTDGR